MNQALKLHKAHRLIKLNPEVWLKTFIDMNTELQPKTKQKLRTSSS